jgi:hypothetical protein
LKTKLLFLTLVLALTATLQPSPSRAAIQQSCLSYCAIVRCLPEYICGSYVNSSGQTVCGCHPRA